MLSQKVFLLLSSLILGVFHGPTWGRALVDCGNNGVCVYSVFDQVVIGSVILSARHELLYDTALEFAVLGWAGLVLQLMRPLYNTIIFELVIRSCLEVTLIFGIILRLKILLHIWLGVVPIYLGIEVAINTTPVWLVSLVFWAGLVTTTCIYGSCALLATLARIWSIWKIVENMKARHE